jgi:outer membrane immunogenic protein
MRSIFAALFLLPVAVPVFAQDVPRAEAALTYTYVHTNAPPGGCGCFSMNGGTGSFAYHLNSKFAGVAEVASVHAGNVDATGLDLTLTSFLFGPRLTHHIPGTRLTPYGQVLVGAVHSTGRLVPISANGASSSTTFAATVGGGLDFRLSHRIAIRPVQIDYFVTTLPNGANDHQNNLRVSSGLVLRF